MSAMLVVLGFIGVLVARALLVNEITGRIRRRVQASLETTITALPDELQAEWADEWRAELAAVITMPLSAARFVHGVRTSARELVADPALAPAGIHGQASARGRLQPGTAERARRALHDAHGRVARFAARLQAVPRLAVDRDRLLRAVAGGVAVAATSAAVRAAAGAVPAAIAGAVAMAVAIAAMTKWRLR